MKHEIMIKSLIEQGLIDKDHNLTPKGHERVAEIKRDYLRKTATGAQKVVAQERAAWLTSWK